MLGWRAFAASRGRTSGSIALDFAVSPMVPVPHRPAARRSGLARVTFTSCGRPCAGPSSTPPIAWWPPPPP
jgi:hypothetical protein